MRFFNKKTAAVGIATVAILAVSWLGVYAFEKLDSYEVGRNEDIQQKAADTVNALDLDKYIRAPQTSLPPLTKRTAAKSTTTKAKSSVVKKTANAQKQVVKDFKVAVPADTTEVFEFDPLPLNFYDIRDYSKEYYTVYDENTGRTVTINAFDMVCQIVFNEISDSWGSEAIKAQAVAAYTYVRFNDEIGNIPTVGLRTGYSGIIEDCVRSVWGQTVTYNGETINAVYSASTAGYTVNSGDMWGVQYPYLRSVESPYDKNDPYYGLRTELSVKDVKSLIESRTDIKLSGNIRNWFTFDSVYSRKYIGAMKIDGHSSCYMNGNYVNITGTTLVNILGLQSNALDIEYHDGSFIFTTYGWGHGVGMSQWGACYYANAGYTYDQILMHYYLDTELTCTVENSKAVERGIELEQQAAEQANKNSEPKSAPVSKDVSSAADSAVQQ